MQTERTVSNGRLDIHTTRYVPLNALDIPMVLLHGFLDNQETIKKYALEFCALGYTVYTYDIPGIAKCTSAYGYDSLSMTSLLNDLDIVIQSVEENKHKLILFGVDFGGFLAVLYASKNPNSVAKLLSESPLLSIPEDARRGNVLTMSFVPEQIEETFKAKKYPFSFQFAKDAISIDIDKVMKSVLCPCCLIFGAKDKILDASYGRKALESLSSDSYVYYIKKASHTLKKKQYLEALNHFKNFLKIQ